MAPRKLTKAVINQLVQHRREGCTFPEACELAGVSANAVYAWRNIGKKAKEGLCRDLYDALIKIEAEVAQKREERRKAILARKIDNLKQQFNQKYHSA